MDHLIPIDTIATIVISEQKFYVFIIDITYLGIHNICIIELKYLPHLVLKVINFRVFEANMNRTLLMMVWSGK